MSMGPLAIAASALPALRAGVCRYCGCTEERACGGGCWWVDVYRTVCSSSVCVERYIGDFAADLRRLHALEAGRGKDVYV